MSSTQARVEQALREFLGRIDKQVDVLAPDTVLYAEGIGLDSLETAELSAVLEDEFGNDPFQSEPMPQTVGDIIGFYDTVSADA